MSVEPRARALDARHASGNALNDDVLGGAFHGDDGWSGDGDGSKHGDKYSRELHGFDDGGVVSCCV